MNQTQTKDSPFVFYIDHTFDAPRERVWKAWTEPEQFKKWMGPKGSEITFCEIDFRPGGAVRYCMEFAGQQMWGQWAYREIIAPEKLVAIVSFTDENGKITAHPMSPNWPLEVFSTVTLTEKDGKTKMAIRWTAHNASAIESATFEEGASGMKQGWGGTFERLEAYLAQP